MSGEVDTGGMHVPISGGPYVTGGFSVLGVSGALGSLGTLGGFGR